MEEELSQELRRAKDRREITRKFFARLKKKKPKNLDQQVHALHEEVFEEIDCLTCANCCKTTSPVFTDIDIGRISKSLRMKPSQFVSEYLHMDAENDYVLNHSPCPFLMHDNCCMIYEVRPKACREYPHTNRKKFHQKLGLTLKNAEICPATARIVSKLSEMNI